MADINTALAVLVLCAFASGQFPKECADNATRQDSTCCPVPPGYSEPCGGQGRGQCKAVPPGTIALDRLPDTGLNDPRLDWPRNYFQKICFCEDRYIGYMCHQCMFGYEGRNCSTKKENTIRKNALSLSKEERDMYRRVMKISKTTKSGYVSLVNGFGINGPQFTELSVYDYLVHVHYLSTKNVENKGKPVCRANDEIFSGSVEVLDFAHNGPGFLTWHRMYMLWAERMFQEAANESLFAFPYWSWGDAGIDCPVCTNDLAGKINYSDPNFYLDQGSIFRTWETVCQLSEEDDGGCAVFPCDLSKPGGPVIRNPGGSSATSMPSMEQILFTLKQKAYDVWPFNPASDVTSLRNCLEGFAGPDGIYRDTHQSTMHVQGHAFFGGHLEQVSISPNDPLFYFHHSYIDKLMEVWIRMNNATEAMYPAQGQAPPGHNLYDAIVPIFPLFHHVDFFVDTRQLGYDYDNMEEVIWLEEATLKLKDKSDDRLPAAGSWWVILVVVCLLSAFICAVVLVVSRQIKKRQRKQKLREDSTPLLS